MLFFYLLLLFLTRHSMLCFDVIITRNTNGDIIEGIPFGDICPQGSYEDNELKACVCDEDRKTFHLFQNGTYGCYTASQINTGCENFIDGNNEVPVAYLAKGSKYFAVVNGQLKPTPLKNCQYLISKQKFNVFIWRNLQYEKIENATVKVFNYYSPRLQVYFDGDNILELTGQIIRVTMKCDGSGTESCFLMKVTGKGFLTIPELPIIIPNTSSLTTIYTAVTSTSQRLSPTLSTQLKTSTANLFSSQRIISTTQLVKRSTKGFSMHIGLSSKYMLSSSHTINVGSTSYILVMDSVTIESSFQLNSTRSYQQDSTLKLSESIIYSNSDVSSRLMTMIGDTKSYLRDSTLLTTSAVDHPIRSTTQLSSTPIFSKSMNSQTQVNALPMFSQQLFSTILPTTSIKNIQSKSLLYDAVSQNNTERSVTNQTKHQGNTEEKDSEATVMAIGIGISAGILLTLFIILIIHCVRHERKESRIRKSMYGLDTSRLSFASIFTDSTLASATSERSLNFPNSEFDKKIDVHESLKDDSEHLYASVKNQYNVMNGTPPEAIYTETGPKYWETLPDSIEEKNESELRENIYELPPSFLVEPIYFVTEPDIYAKVDRQSINNKNIK